MRSRDFFVLDYEATVEINGGHPAIYVLDDEFLSDLRSGPVSHVSDVSAAEGLCDLLEDELLGYVSRGQPSLSDGEVTEASRTLEAVTNADFHAGGSGQLSCEFVADGAPGPPGDAGVGG